MKIYQLFFIVLIFSGFVTSAHAQEINFFRNLKLGDSGSDVLQLQKLLNRSPDTQISTSGAGSPGNETNYFGNLTHQAVIKFQEKFRSEILSPLNLFKGTGFVGQSTISKLKSFYNNSYVNNVPTNTQVVNAKPTITSISPNEGEGNETITIKGENFGDSNTVFVTFDNPNKYTKVKSKNNGTEIEFDLDSSLYENILKTEKSLTSKQKKIFREQSPNYDLYITVLTDGKYSNPQKFTLKVE